MTYQMHLRLSDDLERDVRAYASRYGISISDAIRVLLTEALKESR